MASNRFIDHAPKDLEEEASSCFNLAHDLLNECKAAGNINDLNTAIFLFFQAAHSLLPAHAELSGCLNRLSMALATRFSYTGDLGDVHSATLLASVAHGVICVHDDDVRVLLSRHIDSLDVQDVPVDMVTFASHIFEHFNQAMESGTLNTSIFLHRKALAYRVPSHPERWRSLLELSEALLSEFHVTGVMKALQEAISLLRELHLIQPNRWASLCVALIMEGTQTSSHLWTQEILALGQRAIESDGEAIALGVSGTDFVQVFQQSGNLSDLDVGIAQLKEGHFQLSWGHPTWVAVINNLASAVGTRFDQRGDAQDIDEAIQLFREVLTLPHPDHAGSLNNLAHAVQTRFEQQGDAQDINEVIQLYREALALHPSPHPNRARSLNNLANAVQIRFQQRGDAQDIDESIQLHRETLTLHPSPHPHRAGALNNLATAVQIRFQQRGDAQDIDEAIQLHQEALALRPSAYPDRAGSLNNLANAVRTRFDQQGDAQDINKAIQLHREALALCPSPHPDRGMSLDNLVTDVLTRFQQWGNAQDINEAIQLHREALALHPSPHPNRAGSLNNLARAVQTQFQQRGDAQDIDEAIRLHQEALALHPSPHPNRYISLNNLAILLVSSYEHGRDPNHLNDALALLQEASLYSSSSLFTRFQPTHLWARTAARHHHPSALPAYRMAINLLPQLATLHLDLRFRQQLLTTLTGTDLVSGAAVCAVGLAQYATAVEFLEASRSVFWSQALHLRTPLDRLESSYPDLASQMAALARELEQSSFRKTRRNLSTDRQHEAISIESEGARCQRLNKDWEQAIPSARMLPGFEDFMQPKGIIALKQAAVHGPIAILNAGKSSGHVLLVKPFGEVQCVPLPDISLSGAEFLVKLLRALLSTSTFDLVEFMTKNVPGDNTTPRALVEARILARQEVLDNASPNDVFRNILTELWECIVRPVLDALNLKKSPYPSRLWWCPVGPISFLPIHAAGIYNKHNTDCVSDYVISSYTPTLAALLDPPTHSDAQFKMTAVIQPESKFSPLPGTRTELKRIRERVPEQWLTALGDTIPATKATALAHLQESSIVHFACHGIQDPINPLDSGLLLTDGLLKVSKIMRGLDVSEGIRKSMALAFLSACETAKGDEQVPDEAMHLAATLLFAGFRGVVATMWSMNDLDGPKIADTFYEHLFRNCDPTANPPVIPDLTEGAHALHLAVAKLREEPEIPFMRWVPFVHYGL
ncbi:CHAT domain-containing protein [Mycena maculata]|uniref:CHAT domain-containing protein n=1 Tax=Mycena maculata TaxID=230809 RepID=A0AAD7NT60_9AGAR|nr:CHAT domain-containing protein [Mycena maculata]